LAKVIQHQDEEVTDEDVQSTFAEVGIKDEKANFHQFNIWTHHVFGGQLSSTQDYLEAIVSLTSELELVQTWADKLFKTCEPSDG